jgi:hypothetical protein
VGILLRADAGFARDPLMAWCENNGIDYLFGLAKNGRLGSPGEILETPRRPAAHPADLGGGRELAFDLANLGQLECRVVAKAEWTGGEANPRFVVTSLSRDEHEGRHLYEKLYCARGDMENRIKECQLDLFSDRTSAKTMRANQLRLWFASMAYVLICALRCIALAHTQFARATCATIRLKLLKIGAHCLRRRKLWCAPACAGSSSPCPSPFPTRPSTAPPMQRSPPLAADLGRGVENNHPLRRNRDAPADTRLSCQRRRTTRLPCIAPFPPRSANGCEKCSLTLPTFEPTGERVILATGT